MIRLLLFVIDVCLLRQTPAEAPQHPYAAAITVLLNFILLLWLFARQASVAALFPALQVTFVALLIIWGILALHQRRARYHQAVFTFFSTSLLMGLVLESALQVISAVPEESPIYLLLTLWAFVLWVWSLVIDAHIFRRVLDASFAYGMLMAVALFALNLLLLNWWYEPLITNPNN